MTTPAPTQLAPAGPTGADRHRFERPVQIRFAHCDPAGIVFFPQYLVLLNGFIEDWIQDGIGIPYADLIGQRRIGLPTVSLQCDFTAPSRMGETVTFGLSVLHLGSRSIQLAWGVRLGDEPRVRGRQALVSTSLETHRAVALPDDLRAGVQRALVAD